MKKKKKQKYNIKTERVLPTPEFLKKHEVIESRPIEQVRKDYMLQINCGLIPTTRRM